MWSIQIVSRGVMIRLNETLVSAWKSLVNFPAQNGKKIDMFADGYPRIAKSFNGAECC
jgi:hypothetical protein